MAAIQHILCPVDVSATSEFALTYAALLAKKLGAKLRVLHVYETWSGVYPDDNAALRKRLDEALRPRVDGEIEQMVERCTEGANVTLRLREGVPHAAIVDEAQAAAVDLVVMGTHGRSGIVSLLLGSVAERVMRVSPVPVMTVRKPGVG